MTTNSAPKTPPTPQQEVSLALTDFFVDKEKKVKKDLSPVAAKLAWTIRRLTGAVGFEDLDQIFADCQKPGEFTAFAARAAALEKKLAPGSVAQLSGLEDLKVAEAQVSAPAAPEI